MAEHPILFTGEMVRAILDGRKTMTRRVVKPQPSNPGGLWQGQNPPKSPNCETPLGHFVFLGRDYYCPHGQPGMTLWVRETWAAVHLCIDPETGYADDWHGSHDIPPGNGGGYWTPMYAADDHPSHYDDRGWQWRPSTHMPRWASRITLEITGVRVERVQEISEEDAIAEGMTMIGPTALTNRTSFARLWDTINESRGYGWDVNPWVWVVEFRPCSNGREATHD
jgi:hypothetical protein